MRPWFQTADSNSPSSNSDPTDRRINALVRHLVESSSSAMADSLSASPTSSLHTDSVFAHVVRAPEDPILGVISLFRSIAVGFFIPCCAHQSAFHLHFFVPLPTSSEDFVFVFSFSSRAVSFLILTCLFLLYGILWKWTMSRFWIIVIGNFLLDGCGSWSLLRVFLEI